VELYEQIRREYEFGAGSVIGVARKLGVHRRMVREAVRSAVPAQRKKTERPAVKMAAAATLIDAILESERKAPRKQRHTARRIFDRIRAEVPGCTPAERTVRQYVERRKRELGLAEHETFVPQSYRWGVEAQVDWYEAYADHRPGAHHRDRFRVVSLPENPAEENEGLSRGIRFCFRSALRATLQQNRTPATSTSHRVGQNKPPKWAKPSCQSHVALQLL
jgi:hypothetical protein